MSNVVERGLFIAFEGGDGTGKSTQSKLLAERLGAVWTREPGGTRISENVRAMLLDPDTPEMADRTEALLMAASRAQHVIELIEPTLASGQSVVTDRFVGSSWAYQGVGRGLGDDVRLINEFATAGLAPDVTVFLELDAATADSRVGKSRDRIEQAGETFAAKVEAAFQSFISEPGWVKVPADGSIDEVQERIVAVITAATGKSV